MLKTKFLKGSKDLLVDELDDDVYFLGKTILLPTPQTCTLMGLTRLREQSSVGQVIDSLVTHMEVKMQM